MGNKQIDEALNDLEGIINPDDPEGMATIARLHQTLERQRVPEGWGDLPAKVLAMCKHRGWSMDWTHRGAYLHLESSELIEAVRGKRGSVPEEAGDVLLVLMSITEYHGIRFDLVVRQAELKCKALMNKPRYKGEEHDGSTLAAAPEDNVSIRR